MDVNRNRFYVGTARGVLLYTGDKPNDLKISKNEESSEVTAMAEGRNPEEIVLGYQNGHSHIFDTGKCCFSKKIDELEGEESVTGIGCIKKSIIIAKRDGIINIWTNKKKDYFSINLDEKGSLDAMVCHQNRENILATGGQLNDFKLWDVKTKQCIFKAKSLGHDELQLPIATSVRGISFFLNESNLAGCCTKEGHVLLYDDRAQRRPVVKFYEKQASYTAISTAHRERQVLLGTTKGYMQWLDLRTCKVLKTYTTFTGSVTSIVCDPVEPYVASVSLDRHLRVHHLETKKLVYKCYMKQNLTGLLVKPIVKNEEQSDSITEMENADQEYEELFKGMEEIREENVKQQKRKSLGLAEEKTVKKIKKKKS